MVAFATNDRERAMGDVCSIFQTIESWLQEPKCPRTRLPETRIEIETNDANFDHEMWRQAFLADAPVLRDLLFGASTATSVFEAVCTINRLLFFFVIIKWINLEVWSVVGGGPFAMNRWRGKCKSYEGFDRWLSFEFWLVFDSDWFVELLQKVSLGKSFALKKPWKWEIRRASTKEYRESWQCDVLAWGCCHVSSEISCVFVNLGIFVILWSDSRRNYSDSDLFIYTQNIN